MKSELNKMYKTGLLVLGLCLATASSEAAIAKPGFENPAFKSTVVISGSEIKADQLIKNEVNSQVRNELSEIQLGYINQPLGEMIISKADLTRKLGPLAKNIDLPDKVTIRRTGTLLRGTEIAEKINEICQQQTSDKLKIDLSRIPSNVVLPGNLLDWEINTGSDNRLGMKLFVLNANTDNGPYRQLFQVKISKVIKAAQLVRLAKPGETISKSMIRPKEVEVKSDLSNVPMTWEEALGKDLARFKSAGTLLRESDVREAEKTESKPAAVAGLNTPRQSQDRDNASQWLIKPGENVDFHFNSGTLSMKIPAKAVQGGHAGDEITLINLQNKRRIRGVITEKGKVEYAQK